jgi:hypothetical protein
MDDGDDGEGDVLAEMTNFRVTSKSQHETLPLAHHGSQPNDSEVNTADVAESMDVEHQTQFKKVSPIIPVIHCVNRIQKKNTCNCFAGRSAASLNIVPEDFPRVHSIELCTWEHIGSTNPPL